MKPRTKSVICLAAVAAFAGVSGCSTSRYEEIKADASPNMDTLYQRPEDVDNAIALTFDENSRMFWQDLGRAFYWDRPSRLTREPVPRP
jgi:hypothetical protein